MAPNPQGIDSRPTHGSSDRDERLTLFTLPITCPRCSSDVSLVNATTNGLLAVAVVECRPCEREFEVTARLVPHGRSRAYEERANRAKVEDSRRRREMVPA